MTSSRVGNHKRKRARGFLCDGTALMDVYLSRRCQQVQVKCELQTSIYAFVWSAYSNTIYITCLNIGLAIKKSNSKFVIRKFDKSVVTKI